MKKLVNLYEWLQEYGYYDYSKKSRLDNKSGSWDE